jgi:hypothetical protein
MGASFFIRDADFEVGMLCFQRFQMRRKSHRQFSLTVGVAEADIPAWRQMAAPNETLTIDYMNVCSAHTKETAKRMVVLFPY